MVGGDYKRLFWAPQFVMGLLGGGLDDDELELVLDVCRGLDLGDKSVRPRKLTGDRHGSFAIDVTQKIHVTYVQSGNRIDMTTISKEP